MTCKSLQKPLAIYMTQLECLPTGFTISPKSNSRIIKGILRWWCQKFILHWDTKYVLHASGRHGRWLTSFPVAFCFGGLGE